MRISSSTLVLLTLLVETTNANAARMRMLGRRVGRHARSSMIRRTIMSGKVAGSGESNENALDNASDITYHINMTVAGRQRSVLIDTGSSDLWIIGAGEDAKDTELSATITYAQGDATGHIFTGDVEFAGHHVPNQAYINVTSGDNPSGEGLIGLGPHTSSVIRSKLNSAAGDPVLNRVFALNTSTPNFLSFTLSRTEDPTQPFEGELTVGEYIQGLENVANTPKHPVQILPTSKQGAQHWSLLIDSIIGPDGNTINYTTTVPDEKSPVAVVDSGFSLPQVPRSVADAFYGRIQGAQWDDSAPVGPAWLIPCDQMITASFIIGGITYPIHPLDMSLALAMTDGTTVCYGAFQPSTITFEDASSQFDMVLGMAFLRNTYTVIDFGDFTDANASETEPPFIQLLSLTDTTEAHSDFVRVRTGGTDNTGDPKYALLPVDQGQKSPENGASGSRINLSSVKDKVETAGEKIKRILIIVAIAVGACIVVGLLFCGLSLAGLCVCFGRRRRTKNPGIGLRGREMGQVYQPLHHPAPSSHAPQYGHHGIVNYGNVA